MMATTFLQKQEPLVISPGSSDRGGHRRRQEMICTSPLIRMLLRWKKSIVEGRQEALAEELSHRAKARVAAARALYSLLGGE